MTSKRAIEVLRRIQEPEAWEPAITPEAFEALQMACTALKRSEMSNSSEQPEIVRCGDCTWHGLRCFCHNFDVYGFGDDDFCSQGVRRKADDQ